MAQAPLVPGENTTSLGVRMPMSTAERLTAAAEARGVRRTELIRQALDAWLDAQEPTAA